MGRGPGAGKYRVVNTVAPSLRKISTEETSPSTRRLRQGAVRRALRSQGAGVGSFLIAQLQTTRQRQREIPLRRGSQVKAGRTAHRLAAGQGEGRRAAQSCQPGGGVLAQRTAGACRQHPGHRQAVVPAKGGVRRGVGRVRHGHPAKLQAAIPVGKALGRVEIIPHVQGMEVPQRVLTPPVAVHREVPAPIDIGAVNALGRNRQIPLAAQLEQVGALPHIAEGFPGGQRVDVGPVQAVGALQHQHLAPVLQRAGTQNHIIPSVLLPHLGVPHMAAQPGGIIGVGHQALLGVQRHTVPAGGQAEVMAPACADVIVVAGIFHVAGVIKEEGSLLPEGRAGIDTVAVIGGIGVEHDGQALPVQQIPAAQMAPVLDAAVGVKGSVLVKDVVILPDFAQAVGVIEPAHGGLDVIALAVGVGGHPEGVRRLNTVHQAL